MSKHAKNVTVKHKAPMTRAEFERTPQDKKADARELKKINKKRAGGK